MTSALGAGVEAYLASLAVDRGLSRNTITAYRRDLTDYLAFLDGRLPEPVEVEAYLRRLDASGRSSATIARRLSAVRGLHRFLVSEGLAETDPTVLVDRPRRLQGLPKALTVEEVLALLDTPDRATVKGRRDAALLEFLYATGARVSEALALDLVSLDLEEATVRLLGKGSKERMVPVGRAALEAIRTWLPDRLRLRSGGTDAVFLNLRGWRLSRQGAFTIVRHHAARAGIPVEAVSPHVLRHSAATHMLEGGADLRIVQELLGHASVSTTQVYTRVSPRHLLEIYVQSHPRSR
ncbi:MAG: site-specific tyrosine recombinase [Acidimicrobiia bacterium]